MSASLRRWGITAAVFGLAGCGVDEYNEQIKQRRQQWRIEFRRERALGQPIFDQKQQVYIRPLAGLSKVSDPALLARYEGAVGDEQTPRYMLMYASTSQALRGPAFLQAAERALARSVGRGSWPRQAAVGQVQVDGRTMLHYKCTVRMAVRSPSRPRAGASGSGSGKAGASARRPARRRTEPVSMQFWVYAYERQEAAPPPKGKDGKSAPRAWRVLVAYGCHNRRDVKEDLGEAQRFSIETLKVGSDALGAWQKVSGVRTAPAGKGGKTSAPTF